MDTESKSINRRSDRALIVIIAAFVALSAIYSFVTQLKRGPDEPAHFIYIRSLATEFSVPEIAHVETHTEDSTSSHEAHQPPLYYAVLAIPYAALNAIGLSSDVIWRVLRLLTIPIGAIWIYFVYLLALEFFEKKPYALAATAFVALIPNAAYTAGVVNNDIAISLFTTWALIPILRYFKTGEIKPRSALGLGALMGLAILTKAQGIILPAVFLIVSLAVCRKSEYKNWKQVLLSAGIALGTMALVSGWWFARCYILYKTISPHSLYDPIDPSGIVGALFASPFWMAKATWNSTGLLIGYFWAPFWLMQKFIDFIPYFNTLCALAVIGALGLVFRLRRGKDVDRRSLALLIATAILTYVLWLNYIISVDKMANLQGRLLLPVASIFGIIAVLGFDGWLRGEKAKMIGVITGIVLMLLANAVVIGCAIAFYAGGGI